MCQYLENEERRLLALLRRAEYPASYEYDPGQSMADCELDPAEIQQRLAEVREAMA